MLKAGEFNDKFARAVSDLSGSCPEGSTWTRELVFLDYRHLLVLDRVKPGKDVETRWLLHTVNEPDIDGRIVTADNGKSRLFCKALRMESAKGLAIREILECRPAATRPADGKAVVELEVDAGETLVLAVEIRQEDGMVK